MRWFDYPICVPFGNPNYDSGIGGSHDMDVRTPPNTEITALLSGTIVDIGEPSWGMVIGVKLDQPYKGIPYMAYLHLAAVNVKLNDHIVPGQLIAWSGGCNTADQYAGTTNPTGRNFLNAVSQSSQPQTGIAIMRGPVYGEGAGWETFPPVDWSLDPTQLILDARKGGGTMFTVPQGWHDDGKTLTAPNGVPVRNGFRLRIGEGWHPDNWPLAAEYGTQSLEDSNKTLGSGTQQMFRWAMLGWTQARGVFDEWVGVELDYCRAQLAKAYTLNQQLQAQIVQLKAQGGADALAAIHQAQTILKPF